MKLEIRLTPRARADLDDIWNYTAVNWNPAQAEVYLEALGHTMQLIAQNPDIGSNIEHIRPAYRKFPAASHLLIYRSKNGILEIVRILHKSMDVSLHV